MSTIVGIVDGIGSIFTAISEIIISNFLDNMFLIYASKLFLFNINFLLVSAIGSTIIIIPLAYKDIKFL